tara:strand:+ start:141 stop:410 length:270 start_codon:yes stop_codon:yes gene_type:complete
MRKFSFDNGMKHNLPPSISKLDKNPSARWVFERAREPVIRKSLTREKFEQCAHSKQLCRALHARGPFLSETYAGPRLDTTFDLQGINAL